MPETGPEFTPFRALRYASVVDQSEIVAPPYDVLSADDRRALIARHEHNAVRVDLPRDDDPEIDAYQRAADLVTTWRSEGVLGQDEIPAFTVYRMSVTGLDGSPRVTLGVLGALSIGTFGDGKILPHEHTTPKDKADRLSVLKVLGLNTSPIWGLSMAPGLTQLLDPGAEPALASALDDDGVLHEWWPITDPSRVEAISAAVSSTPVIVADGHHRYETAHAFVAEEPGVEGATAILSLIVELAEDTLEVRPIHRLVGLPEGVDAREAFSASFDITDVPSGCTGEPDHAWISALVDAGVLVLITPSGTVGLRPRDDAFPAGTVLDSQRLAYTAQLCGATLTYHHSPAHVAALVAAGESSAAVLIRPVTIPQINAVAEQGFRMPPKSTFFWPKPRSGSVFRDVRSDD